MSSKVPAVEARCRLIYLIRSKYQRPRSSRFIERVLRRYGCKVVASVTQEPAMGFGTLKS
jgi:hypothetical protein